MVLGEAPGRIEDYKGKPFVGPAGQLLRRSLSEVGLNPDDAYYMNVVSCWPHGTPTTIHINACRGNLKDQLEVVDSKYVLCCGATALKALIPHATLKSVSGMLIPVHDKYVFPVLHPAYFLNSKVEKAVLEGWKAQLAKFSLRMHWGDVDGWLETKCIYCEREGFPACKRHTGFWAADQKWAFKNRRTKKKGLQDERLF